MWSVLKSVVRSKMCLPLRAVLLRGAILVRTQQRFAEMTRFGLAMGAQSETLTGLSGLGDLVLTCTSVASRNYSLGVALGRGQSATNVFAAQRSVIEGAFTAPVLRSIARKVGVDMPVVDAVCALLDGQQGVDSVVTALLSRPLRAES
jgi:glycerol-3-phosphate dehydrogenase (NAD(P)+)